LRQTGKKQRKIGSMALSGVRSSGKPTRQSLTFAAC
jgi:hypothetical protein